MDELKKPSVTPAAATSMAVVCFLMLEAASKPKNDILEAITTIALLVLAAGAIANWVKYVRNYVDFAIEQKLREINKKPED